MDSDESFDEEGFSASDGDDDNMVLLHSDSCEGQDSDLEEMKIKLLDNPSSLDHKSFSEPYIHTPLQKAVKMKHMKCIEFLLEAGVDINSKNSYGTTALQIALGISDGFQIVELLLAKGASPNFQPRENDPGFNRSSNLILVSTNQEALSQLKLLLQYGAVTEDLENMESTTYYFFHTPLSVTIFHCNLAATKVLLLHGAVFDLRKVNHCSISTDLIDRHSLPHILVRYCTKSVELKKIAFTMLQQFGVDIQQKNQHNVSTKDFVITMGRNRQATEEYVKEIVGVIDELACKPLTLQSLCRITIKKSIGKGYVKKLSKLPYLPPQVMGFLNFDEFHF